jgi:hypothetical protein
MLGLFSGFKQLPSVMAGCDCSAQAACTTPMKGGLSAARFILKKLNFQPL